MNLNKRYRGHAGICVTGLPDRRAAHHPATGHSGAGRRDDLAALLVAAANRAALEDGDVVVVAQKAVSKVEGRVVDLDGIEPSDRPDELAGDEDARRLEVIPGRAIDRSPTAAARNRRDATRLVCASAGVDQSNARGPDTLVLLPLDPDASARRLRDAFSSCRQEVAVIVSDPFGRPFRRGTTDSRRCVGNRAASRSEGTARLGGYISMPPRSQSRTRSPAPPSLSSTRPRIPAAIVRGLNATGEGSGQDLLMPPSAICFDSGQLDSLGAPVRDLGNRDLPAHEEWVNAIASIQPDDFDRVETSTTPTSS